MTAGASSNVDVITLPPDGAAAVRRYVRLPAIMFVLGLVAAFALIAIGGRAGWAGFLVVAFAAFALIVGVEGTVVSTFDFVRRQATITRVGLFGVRERTLPFDAIQWLNITRGCGGGAVLWLKDGTVLKAADGQTNLELDRRIAEIRARSGVAAARLNRPLVDLGSGVIAFAPPGRRILGQRLIALLFFLVAFIGFVGAAMTVRMLPEDWKLGLLFFGSAFLLFTVMGVSALKMPIPKQLLLDPATRKVHVDWYWPDDWRQTIAFEDIVAAGVVGMKGPHHHHSVQPYLTLVSGRNIILWDGGDGVRSAVDIVALICRATGAVQKNVRFP